MEMLGENSRYIAYIELDEKEIVVSCSKAFLELFSISTEQLEGVPVHQLLRSEELQNLLISHREKKMANRAFAQSEGLVSIVSKRKVLFWCIVEVITKNGHDIVYFHDRTESYQAQMILESAMMLESDLFLFFDTRECVLQCSEEAVRIFGFPNRLEAFGLHCTTFFHNRLEEGILSDLFETLEEGNRYEGTSRVRYKGDYKYYEIRAFNVMMKGKKAGMAVCLKETEKSEVYVSGEKASMVECGMSPYVVRSVEEAFDPFFEMKLSEVRSALYEALCVYEYNRCKHMVEYLLCYDGEREKETYGTVMEYLKAFCYEQAADVVKSLL